MTTRHRIGLPEFLDSGFEFSGLAHERAGELIGRYPNSRSALLPLLHLVQSEEGCVSVAGLQFCAAHLDLTTAEVAAVASFYTMYKRQPCGEHLVSVCTNTLCAMLGGDAIFNTLSRHLGVGRDETAGEPGDPGIDHAGVGGVPGRLRPRAGGHRRLRVLRRAEPGQRVGPGPGAAAGREAAPDPRRGA